LGYGPRIAETFALNEAKSALERFASGKAKGKVVVVI
jgi:NADPH:quinone reductase-like Zn-dependent oxidoreductase